MKKIIGPVLLFVGSIIFLVWILSLGFTDPRSVYNTNVNFMGITGVLTIGVGGYFLKNFNDN
jgi:hypothetical protein